MPISGPSLEAPADLLRLLDRGLRTDPDGCALYSLEVQWTWRELEELSGRLARHYLGLGLQPGGRVASLMPNRGALVVHYLACIKAGLVAMPLNYRYRHSDLDHALGLAKPSLLLAHGERTADLAASQRVADLPLGIVSFEESLGSGPRLEDLIERPAPQIDLPVPDRDAPALIFFTSGSTGKPKGTTHSLNTFGWMVASNAGALDLTEKDVVTPCSWISHTASLRLTLSALWAGAQANVASSFDADGLLPLLRRTAPTIMLILPATLAALVHDHGAQAADFRSLRMLMAAGDRSPEELRQAVLDLAGIPISGLYGLTELGTTHINRRHAADKSGSIGSINPGYTSSLRDPDGNEVPVGEDGRHWVRGPTVMLGYWEDENATREAIRDGWFDTGDILRVDADGDFWFRGRSKQIIVHDGSNISPGEVEDALMAHPAVENAGVVGVHDAVHGEDVWAYVCLKQGAPRPSMQDIIRFARERIGYKAPDVVTVLDALPLSISGKLDRTALKKIAAERAGLEHPG